jgi:outer membrane protein OmpA-like peptidoglycan-associated protein
MKKIIISAISLFWFSTQISAQVSPEKFLIEGQGNAEISKPLLTPDGSRLYFVKTYNDERNKEVQETYFIDLENGKAKSAPKILNITGLEDPQIIVGINSDGSRIYSVSLTRNLKNYGQPALNRSNKVGDKYQFKDQLQLPNLGDDGKFLDLYISQDETIILLSYRNKSNTQGEEDLYAIQRLFDGSFSKPVNLGKAVNSPSFEICPFLSEDNKVLYFASNRSGTTNLYKSERLGFSITEWSTPVAVKELNSENYDAYLSFNNNGRGFFVSNRGGAQKAELYTFKFSTSSNQSEEAPKDVFVSKKNEVASIGSPEEKLKNENKALEERLARLEQALMGNMQSSPEESVVKSDSKTRNLGQGSSPKMGSTQNETKPNLPNIGGLEARIAELERELSSLKNQQPEKSKTNYKGGGVEPKNRVTAANASSFDDKAIFFAIDKTFIDEQGKSVLNQLGNYLNANPNKTVVFNGYADSMGHPVYNKGLSERRAKACANFLESLGISKERISTIGHGESDQRVVTFTIK